MGQRDKKLRIVEVELSAQDPEIAGSGEGNGRRSPLWDEVVRLLFREPLTTSQNGGKVLGVDGEAREEEDEDG